MGKHGQRTKFFKLRNFGLSLVLLAFFTVSVAGQVWFGFHAFNEERRMEHQPELGSVAEYLRSGHFVSSVSENMESEFLQMALFVFLTMCLIQKGSAESKKPEEELTKEEREEQRREGEYSARKRKEHGFAWRLYESSLTVSLGLLFLFFFLAHAYGSWMMINEEHARLGQTLIRFGEVFAEPEFWFESFQNWQSEFFSIAVMGLLSIFLRQKDSPQSKRLSDPHWKTGDR